MIEKRLEMEPYIGRIAFNIGLFILILAMLPIFFLDRSSAEFVIDMIAISVTSIFLLLVVWDVRRQAKAVKK